MKHKHKAILLVICWPFAFAGKLFQVFKERIGEKGKIIVQLLKLFVCLLIKFPKRLKGVLIDLLDTTTTSGVSDKEKERENFC